MRAFNTGMAVFDGAMLGIKLMKKSEKYSDAENQPGYKGIIHAVSI